jgi:hypothetical protein
LFPIWLHKINVIISSLSRLPFYSGRTTWPGYTSLPGFPGIPGNHLRRLIQIDKDVLRYNNPDHLAVYLKYTSNSDYIIIMFKYFPYCFLVHYNLVGLFLYLNCCTECLGKLVAGLPLLAKNWFPES